MDKKTKKKLDVLRQRLTGLRQKLAAAKTQVDDPEDVRVIEDQIRAAEQEIEKLKAQDAG